jgi:hypothetical protein
MFVFGLLTSLGCKVIGGFPRGLVEFVLLPLAEIEEAATPRYKFFESGVGCFSERLGEWEDKPPPSTSISPRKRIS